MSTSGARRTRRATRGDCSSWPTRTRGRWETRVPRPTITCHHRRTMTDPLTDGVAVDPHPEISFDLEQRQGLRRVPGLATELTDVTEVEYRQLRLERVVLVGVWT